MKSLLALLLLLGVLGSVSAAPPAKKLIEYGSDVPTPAYVRDHLARMEQRPFDGLVMRCAAGAGQVFGKKRWEDAEMAADFEALRQIDWQKFTDSFVMAYASAESDWFSDADWDTVTHNLGLLAKGARMGRCKGIAFDPGPQGGSPWSYSKQAHAKEKSFEDYQAMVRKRGAQFVQAVTKEMPNARILTLFQLSRLGDLLREPDPARRDAALAGQEDGLLPAFLNGMLDAAGPDVVITDGNEASCGYTTPMEYYRSYHTMRQAALALVAPGNARKYRLQVQASQAVNVDQAYQSRDQKSIVEGLTPDERSRWLESNTYYALTTSDEYVWLFSDKMNWWKDEGVPPGAVEAMISARQKVSAGKPLGFDLAEIMRAARQRFEEMVRTKLVTRTAGINRVKRGVWPTIDGNLADPAWQGIRPLEPFLGCLGDGSRPAKPSAETRAWVTYDDSYLYIAVRCEEPDTRLLKVQGEQRDGPVADGDSIDVCLSATEVEVPYYHFVLNPKNVQWDAFCSKDNADTDYSPDWRSAVAIGNNEWTAEMAIPWTALKRTVPEYGTRIFANICRRRLPTPELTSWSQCVLGFEEPQHFGSWTFR